MSNPISIAQNPQASTEVLLGTAGAAHVLNQADLPFNTIKYAGGGYTYYCEAAPSATCARSATIWRVFRVTDATQDTVFAGTGAFEHAATSLATVAALTFTMGA